jgi:hypothetical protein
MILKIQTKCNDVYGWRFIDDLKSVDYLNVRLTENELKAKVDNADNIYFSTMIKDMGRFKKTGKIPIMIISHRNNKDEFRSLLLNMACYLLNDNGQTIEKIN